MTTTTRTFQREFKRMKQLASEGKTILIHDASGKDFVFSTKRAGKNPLLNCMPGAVIHYDETPLNEEWEAEQ